MQITEDQIELWTTSPNQFVEDDDVFAYNVRISAQELLTVIDIFSNDKWNGITIVDRETYFNSTIRICVCRL